MRHPETGLDDFGYFPALAGLSESLTSAPIVLTYGRQGKNGKGLGALHIWDRHADDLKTHGVMDPKDVGHYIAQTLVAGTLVYRAPTDSHPDRIVARRRCGDAVFLGLTKLRGRSCWMVITAYGRYKAHGKPLGTVRHSGSEQLAA